ncbi:hypothetical protein KP509_05G103100 [Ceratopteris richardii]|uniref:RING-CH-type domain-containing protein n=1 Tax=Ceratopteris richardii TaxID=49495 RepID=A0A8T2V1F5_CERRI|nr:hypothetical protein KP509_05G103100 [Ceratopteris richardii]KAH7438049.1 hypothetical protein KP509_05G103100 [Ceratopteris richardii]KAH7438050.1 hypothetical protein KP509_05G103100 [Ceratopteris richardii]
MIVLLVFLARNEMSEILHEGKDELYVGAAELEREPFLCSQQENVNTNLEAESSSNKKISEDLIPQLEITKWQEGVKVSESDLSVLDEHQCRICLDVGGDDLISPCQCKGTQKYVHRSCLDHWRAAKEGFAFAHCTECRTLFRLRANVPADRWWLRLKFQLLVLRDHAAIYIIVQLVVAAFSLLIYSLYGEELKEMFGYEHHPYGFHALAVIVILLVGLLYGFFIAIICGQNISNRHYHVLAKQELTKEYIVEDSSDTEPPPILEPGHISELRSLGLY